MRQTVYAGCCVMVLTTTKPDIIITNPVNGVQPEAFCGGVHDESPSVSLGGGVPCGELTPSLSPFTCLYGCEIAKSDAGLSPVVLSHKKARFYLRAFLGLSVAIDHGYRLRWFTFTESDECLRAGLSVGKAMHRFWDDLRYWCPDVQYCVIEHRQGKPSIVSGKRRRNLHCLTYGSDKLPVDKCREFWQRHYLSAISGMQEVRYPAKAINYLAKYLSADEKFVRAWTSRNWIFEGWVGRSKAFKAVFGYYPPKRELIRLALMPRAARYQDSLYLVLEACYRQGRSLENHPLSFVPVWRLAQMRVGEGRLDTPAPLMSSHTLSASVGQSKPLQGHFGGVGWTSVNGIR